MPPASEPAVFVESCHGLMSTDRQKNVPARSENEYQFELKFFGRTLAYFQTGSRKIRVRLRKQMSSAGYTNRHQQVPVWRKVSANALHVHKGSVCVYAKTGRSPPCCRPGQSRSLALEAAAQDVSGDRMEAWFPMHETRSMGPHSNGTHASVNEISLVTRKRTPRARPFQPQYTEEAGTLWGHHCVLCLRTLGCERVAMHAVACCLETLRLTR